MKYGIFDETVGMWLEKDTSEYQSGFTVCRPEQVELSWDDWREADKVRDEWQKELGEEHRLSSAQIKLPSEYDENGIHYPVHLNADPHFPEEVTWETLKNFLPAKEGATRPMVGKIGEDRFIVKFDFNTSREHVENEIFADKFIRAAGFNAPLSREYFLSQSGDKPFSCIRLAQYLDDCVALKKAHQYFPFWNWEVKRQIVDAYPMVALMANLDAFHNDNVLVDRKGKVWFVDNAASFAFRAKGLKKEKASGFSYDWDSRTACYDKPENGGMMGVYEYSKQLQKLLGRFTRTDVLRSIWRGPDLRELVKNVPDEYQSKSLVLYADSMMEDIEEEFEDGTPSHAWKYAWKFYNGAGKCPFDGAKDPTAAFFWSIEHDIECVDGREQIVEWLFDTSRPNDWPSFMKEVTATRDELAIVLFAYETESRLRYGNPHVALSHYCLGTKDLDIDWKRYFAK